MTLALEIIFLLQVVQLGMIMIYQRKLRKDTQELINRKVHYKL